MRDRLIHDYGGIDYAIVWDVTVNKAPALAEHLRGFISNAERAGNTDRLN
jgi:uncharacterized protein with HEPN domain